MNDMTRLCLPPHVLLQKGGCNVYLLGGKLSPNDCLLPVDDGLILKMLYLTTKT